MRTFDCIGGGFVSVGRNVVLNGGTVIKEVVSRVSTFVRVCVVVHIQTNCFYFMPVKGWGYCSVLSLLLCTLRRTVFVLCL